MWYRSQGYWTGDNDDNDDDEGDSDDEYTGFELGFDHWGTICPLG